MERCLDTHDDDTHGDDTDEDEADITAIPPIAHSSEPIITPEDGDVICGRGKSVSHPGNKLFRDIVLTRRDEYRQAKRREEKTRIASEIVETMRRGPGASRFLLKDAQSGMWYDVGDVYAREKVSHALRSRPNEERQKKPRAKYKMTKKATIPNELEGRVQDLIHDQQSLLKAMIEKELFTGAPYDSSATNSLRDFSSGT